MNGIIGAGNGTIFTGFNGGTVSTVKVLENI
jgi:hypothetical protein